MSYNAIVNSDFLGRFGWRIRIRRKTPFDPPRLSVFMALKINLNGGGVSFVRKSQTICKVRLN